MIIFIAEKIAAFGTKPSDDDTFKFFFEKKEDELSGPTGVTAAKKGIVLTDDNTEKLLELLMSCIIFNYRHIKFDAFFTRIPTRQ